MIRHLLCGEYFPHRSEEGNRIGFSVVSMLNAKRASVVDSSGKTWQPTCEISSINFGTEEPELLIEDVCETQDGLEGTSKLETSPPTFSTTVSVL